MIKSLIIFSYVLLSISQDTSSSILDLYEIDELTPTELEEQKDNIEKSENTQTDAEISDIDVSGTQISASFGLYNELSEISLVNSELSMQNSLLQSELLELQTLINDTNEKINGYKNDYEITSKPLKEEILALDNYNHKIIRDKLNAKENSKLNNNSDEDKDKDKNEIHKTSILVISIGLLFLLLQNIKIVFGNSMNESFNPSLYVLFENITVLIIVSVIGCLIGYIDPFENIYYEHILAGIAIFILIWLFFGIFLL